MTTKHIHNWLQIDRSSYTDLHNLITRETFIPTDVEPCGPRGEQTYILAPNTPIAALNDDTIRIADMEITAQLSHQPTHAYRAMVAASPGFEQYRGIDLLLRVLRSLRSNLETQQFAELLENTVHRGRQLDTTPRLVVIPQTYNAVWKAQETYIRQTPQGHWMLALSYDASYKVLDQAPEKCPVGLDLGLDPVTVAYTSTGVEQVFRATALTHLRELETRSLSEAAQKLLDNLTYASGRLDTERVVAWLLHHASAVFAERLTHHNMNQDFIFRARNLAIHDHHYASLAQYLYTAGVPFKRVPARHTSRLCPRCRETNNVYVLGDRSGDQYHCERCGYTDNSHRVGARNVLLNGLGQSQA